MKAIQQNKKTIRSFDPTTDCPKRRRGEPCSYCYVEAARKAGYNAKAVCTQCTYNGEVLRYTQAMVDRLNDVGGIRMFSFGDYMAEHDDMIRRFLADCHARGLAVKVITKVPAFVDKWHAHPAISTIHLSVDNVGHGVDWDVARDYRRRYHKVRVRCAVMKPEDFAVLEPWCDILTLNHARGLKSLGYRTFTAADRRKAAMLYPNKVCCQTGTCETCPVKCGLA